MFLSPHGRLSPVSHLLQLLVNLPSHSLTLTPIIRTETYSCQSKPHKPSSTWQTHGKYAASNLN